MLGHLVTVRLWYFPEQAVRTQQSQLTADPRRTPFPLVGSAWRCALRCQQVAVAQSIYHELRPAYDRQEGSIFSHHWRQATQPSATATPAARFRHAPAQRFQQLLQRLVVL